MQTSGLAIITSKLDMSALAAILPAMQTLTGDLEPKYVRRDGTAMRVHRPEATLSAHALAAAEVLAHTGAKVKILEGTRVLTARVTEDGTLVWDRRATNRDRAHGGDHMSDYFGLTELTVVVVEL